MLTRGALTCQRTSVSSCRKREAGKWARKVLTVVLVTDNDPASLLLVAVLGSDLRDTAPGASEDVLDLVGLAVSGVDLLGKRSAGVSAAFLDPQEALGPRNARTAPIRQFWEMFCEECSNVSTSCKVKPQ